MRQIDYQCGCKLKQEGLDLCTFHLVIFDIETNEMKNGLSQERYLQLTHALNVKEEEHQLEK